jgi:hypothetical protein
MRIDWRVAGGALIVVGAVVGTVLGISLGRASGGSEAAQYEVTLLFNASVTQQDIEETEALLGTFDTDPEYVIMESFPPVGRAVMASDASDFCQKVRAELEAKDYINRVTCKPWADIGEVNPDAPISNRDQVE